MKRCWRDLQLEDVRYSLLQAQTARDFVLEILKLKPIVATKVSIMLWKWWDERNWVNAGDTKRPVSDIVRVILLSCSVAESRTQQAPTRSMRGGGSLL